MERKEGAKYAFIKQKGTTFFDALENAPPRTSFFFFLLAIFYFPFPFIILQTRIPQKFIAEILTSRKTHI